MDFDVNYFEYVQLFDNFIFPIWFRIWQHMRTNADTPTIQGVIKRKGSAKDRIVSYE